MNNAQSPSPPSPSNTLPQTEEKQPSLVERVASLEASNKALAEVVNANAAIMRDCLEVTEAIQWMIMQALDDIGTNGALVRTETGRVDWEHYKAKYFTFQEELRAQAQAAEATATATEDGIPADAVVFGGSGG